MTPILFPSSSSSFTTQGIGRLADTLSCVVTEERNGEYELEIDYPIGGRFFEDITSNALILAKPNPTDDPQPFRIYSITKPLNGICTIHARHISYDLSGIPVMANVSASTAGAALLNMKEQAPTNNFTFTSDITTVSNFSTNHVGSIRSFMGGQAGSVLDVFGGEYHYDKFLVELKASRGANNGFTIRYGKNLLDLKQEEKCANCYTGVVSYYQTDTDYVQGTVQDTGVSLGYSRVLIINATDDYETPPTATQLNEYSAAYITSHELSAPQVSLSVSFAQLGTAIESVALCDTVTVIFDLLGVQAQAKIVKTTYNVLLERFDKVEIGTVRVNLADTIVEAAKEVAQLPTASGMSKAISNATDTITGVNGGYVVLNRDANGAPYELLVMDTDSIDTATKVWRWNQNGLGYSSEGYSGSYGLAMTQDGSIVADYVNAGILQSGDNGETFYLDLNGGVLRMKASDIYLGNTNIADTINLAQTNADELEDISGYLRYYNGVVTIGDSNSQIALQVQNDRLAFVDVATSEELAYFSNNRLYVPNLTVTSTLDFGNYRLNQSNGGLTFIWVGD